METSSKPHTSARLLAAAAPLTFRATTRDRSGSTVGVLVDPSGVPLHLVIEGDGVGGTWAFCGALPAGKKAVLLYESTANVLRGGEPAGDDQVLYQGELYTVEARFDGDAWMAKISSSS